MGICCQSKEVICANNIFDVPVYIDENKPNNAKNNNNTNNNSANNDNNNTFNKNLNNNNIIIKNINNNNQTSKETEQKSGQFNKEGKRKSILIKEESKEIVIKQSSEEKDEKKSKPKNKKKVAFFAKNNFDMEINTDENQKKNRKPRSTLSQKKLTNLNFNDFESNKSNKDSNGPKFQRNKKKAITLVDKNSRLPSKLRGVEMKISVIQETLVTQKFGDPDKYYKKLKELGSGSYGSVYQAKNIIMDNIVAIKMIEKVEDNMIDDMEIKNEINILKSLSHPNIVKIYEFYDTVLYYYIVTEYCKKGELFSYIKNKYSEKQLAVLFYQVFSGLCYLHEKKILHRDLKLENILITEIEKDKKTNDKYFWVKIIDFGTAKIFEKNKNEKAVVGSSYYIAPEVLHKNYNEKCDTWSVGVILYMLIVGRAPFDGQNDEEIIENIEKGEFNSKHKKLLNSSAEVQDLVKKLLEVNVKKRLSSSEALKHPWFKKFNGKSLYSNIDKETVMIYLNRLRKFEINSKFQQMVLAFIVHNIPNNNESKDILKIFRMFNTNDDGKLTKKELLDGLIKYFNEKEIKKEIDDIFLLLDGANRGFIEYEEFLRATLEQKTLLSNENLTYAFNFFDGDGCGKITVEKIKKFFVNDKVSEDVFRNIFNEIDSNGDGEIDYDEFKDMMFGN